MVKESTYSTLGTILVNLLRNVAARGNSMWRIDYLGAKSNSADAPSRWCAIPEREARTTSEGRPTGQFLKTVESWGVARREATLFSTLITRERKEHRVVDFPTYYTFLLMIGLAYVFFLFSENGFSEHLKIDIYQIVIGRMAGCVCKRMMRIAIIISTDTHRISFSSLFRL